MLSPIVILIGVIGNGLTIVVMTRKRMRSSTNCYLAALASVDLAYLLFTFALSLKHYPGGRHPKYGPYWRALPVLMMLADACTNISVWLTASFTLERFIVVSHPIKGKVICTESRARKTCACIFTFCLLFVLPTPFEWTVVEQVEQSSANIVHRSIGNQSQGATESPFAGEAATAATADPSRSAGSSVPLGSAPSNNTYLAMYPSEFGQNQTYKSVYYWLTAVLFIFIPLLTLIIFNWFLIRSVRNSRKQRTKMTQSKYAPANSQSKQAASRKKPSKVGSSSVGLVGKLASSKHAPSSDDQPTSSRSSSPGESGTERKHLQQQTTGLSRMEQQSAKQETKITVMLISVVFLFLICQLPVACSLIYTSIRELDPNRNEFYVVTAINNIINLMVAVNAAGNFVLYCLLSQKYRRTLVTLFCPCFKRRLARLGGQSTLGQTAIYSTGAHSQRFSNGAASVRRRSPLQPDQSRQSTNRLAVERRSVERLSVDRLSVDRQSFETRSNNSMNRSLDLSQPNGGDGGSNVAIQGSIACDSDESGGNSAGFPTTPTFSVESAPSIDKEKPAAESGRQLPGDRPGPTEPNRCQPCNGERAT